MNKAVGPVPYINCFEVPAAREDEFLRLFEQVNAHMRSQPGYIGHRLHRALAPDARFRFINYVFWASVEDFRAAHGESFRRIVSQPEWRDFKSTPTLCEIVHRGGTDI